MATRIELEQNSTRNQLILEPFPDGIYGKVTPEQLLIYNPPVFSPTVLKICVGSKSKNKDGIAIGEPALTEALMETSRVIADSQNESGIRFGVWPRGNILQLDSQHFGGAKARAYTYMTGSEIDATPFITDFKKREYNSNMEKRNTN